MSELNEVLCINEKVRAHINAWQEARLKLAGVLGLTIDEENSENEILATCRSLKQRRDARAKYRRNTSMMNLAMGWVGGKYGQHKYAAPNEVKIRNDQKDRTIDWANSHWIHNAGTVINMGELMMRSASQQFAEIYAIIKGVEKWAEQEGLSATFITLTAPPRMHASPVKGRNTWDGTSPRAAQAWIHKRWHRVLAKLKKKGIEIAGLRVVEPHKDGCPHWHIMVWSLPEHIAEIEDAIRKAAPEWAQRFNVNYGDDTDSKDKKKGKHYGADFVAIDTSIGNATSYLFKYLAKSIATLGKLEGDVAAIDAWRACWGIRAFQFFGIPALRDWRNFRRMTKAPDGARLAGLYRACKRGDAQAWIGLSGGLCVRQKDRPVRTYIDAEDDEFKMIYAVDKESGEVSQEEMKKWEIIDEERKTSIEKEQANHMVAVIPNDPSKAKDPFQTPSMKDGIILGLRDSYVPPQEDWAIHGGNWHYDDGIWIPF